LKPPSAWLIRLSDHMRSTVACARLSRPCRLDFLPRLGLQRSPHAFDRSSCSGLRSAPDCRTRRASFTLVQCASRLWTGADAREHDRAEVLVQLTIGAHCFHGRNGTINGREVMSGARFPHREMPCVRPLDVCRYDLCWLPAVAPMLKTEDAPPGQGPADSLRRSSIRLVSGHRTRA